MATTGGDSWLQKIAITVGILVVVIPACWGAWRYYVKLQQIKVKQKLADDYQSHDEFEKATGQLKEARKIDPEGRETGIRLVEVSAFAIATKYDQVKLVKDKKVLEQLDDDCRQLNSEVGRTARILALCGIVKELHDRPTEAIQDYEQAAKLDPHYANAQNYWGYTIFKWDFGTEWATDALSHFSAATSIDRNYPFPYMNTAAVHLRQGNPDRAKESLETATRLLPESEKATAENQTVEVGRGCSATDWRWLRWLG